MNHFEYKAHIALPMKNKAQTQAFYDDLGFKVLDFSPSELLVDFFDQHLAFHELGESAALQSPDVVVESPEKKDVAIAAAHFGAFVTAADYREMLQKLQQKDIQIPLGPNVYQHQGGVEEYMVFFVDCNGITFELKASSDDVYPIDKIEQWSHTNTHLYNDCH